MSPVTPLAPRDRLIVALDLPTVREAEALIETLGDTVGFYKIGYQLAFERGLPLAAGARRRRQARVPRHEAARHRQHGRAREWRTSPAWA